MRPACRLKYRVRVGTTTVAFLPCASTGKGNTPPNDPQAFAFIMQRGWGVPNGSGLRTRRAPKGRKEGRKEGRKGQPSLAVLGHLPHRRKKTS